MQRALATLFSILALAASPAAAQDDAADYRARPPEDEIIYFLLPDRFENGDPSNDTGGIPGGPLQNGFDPTSKAFYNGGDLSGLIDRLDYIEALGATAIWLGPIYVNKPVQGGPGHESAGYHGYWITDFTRVDPHLGSNDDMAELVEALHARGMKIYLDIITNHTADVIGYAECPNSECAYRSVGDYPYRTRGGPDGAPINDGFLGDNDRSEANFARLTDPNFAYTPVVPEAEKSVKVPAWLNDPIYYHNRGNTTFRNENSTMGDFVGLDDLFTEHPRVVAGMIDIFGGWIDRYKVDGFRIDTARHVNPEFWQAFVPAMQARARANGIPNFHIFGEVATDEVDPGYLALFTRRDGYPAVLDFAFQVAARMAVSDGAGTAIFGRLFEGDVLYAGGEAGALTLPTFLGNHDRGRLSGMIRGAHPDISQEELLARMELAHAILFFARGTPTVYSGDEQGFVSDGIDQDAREPLFPSRVASYNDNDLLGSDKTTADANFDTDGPLFRTIAELSRLRREHAALRRGRTLMRSFDDAPGLLAWSRFDPETGREYVAIFNTANVPVKGFVETEVADTAWEALAGTCAPRSAAPGSIAVDLPPFGWALCAARAGER